jgi:DNA-binding transcriptional LysR family regulator
MPSRDVDIWRIVITGARGVSARLNFRQIEAFRAVMLTGTTIAAANMLNRTQQSISRSLAQIQSAAMLKLFELDRGRLRPTPEAVMLFEAVQRNFLGLEAIEETIALLRRSGIGRLRVACTPALGMSVMPAVMAKFKVRQPEVHITLRTISSYDVREGLLNGLYDLGVTTNSPQLEGAQLQTRVVDQVAAVCVMSRSHRLATNAHVGPRHFESETLLTLDRQDDLSDEWRRALARAKVVPSSVIETTYSATICRLAEVGAGIGVVNPYIASVFSDRLRVVPVKPAIGVKIFVAYPRHVSMSALASEFIAQVTHHFSHSDGSLFPLQGIANIAKNDAATMAPGSRRQLHFPFALLRQTRFHTTFRWRLLNHAKSGFASARELSHSKDRIRYRRFWLVRGKAVAMRIRCLLISGSEVRALVRRPNQSLSLVHGLSCRFSNDECCG